MDMDRAAKSWGFERRFLRKGFSSFFVSLQTRKWDSLSSVAGKLGLSSVRVKKNTTKKGGLYINHPCGLSKKIMKSFLDYQKPLPKAITFYRLSLRSHQDQVNLCPCFFDFEDHPKFVLFRNSCLYCHSLFAWLLG